MGEKSNGNVIKADEEFQVDASEFELVKLFLTFIRDRERGVFTANIVTNSKNRFVIIDLVDKCRIKLKPISSNE